MHQRKEAHSPIRQLTEELKKFVAFVSESSVECKLYSVLVIVMLVARCQSAFLCFLENLHFHCRRQVGMFSPPFVVTCSFVEGNTIICEFCWLKLEIERYLYFFCAHTAQDTNCD
jgi:hypothetical protein